MFNVNSIKLIVPKLFHDDTSKFSRKFKPHAVK